MRRFSSFVNPGSSSKTPTVYENDDNRSASTIIQSEPLPTPTLKVKRVDNYYSRWSKTWTYRVRCCDIVMYGAQLMYSLYNRVEHELQEHG